jgi:hypothetical protein
MNPAEMNIRRYPVEVGAPDGNTLLMHEASGGPPPSPIDREPGLWGRVKAGLPRLISSVVAAGAMPSIAGGGPLDIFRAMQAGNNELQRQDMLAYDMQRQRWLDSNKTAEMADMSKLRKAQAKYYEANASNKQEDNDVMRMYKAWEQNPTEENWLRYLQAKGNAPRTQARFTKGEGGRMFDTELGKYVTLDTSTVEGRLAFAQKQRGLPDTATISQLPEEDRAWVLTGKLPGEAREGNPTAAYFAGVANDPSQPPAMRQWARDALKDLGTYNDTQRDPAIAEARRAGIFTEIDNRKFSNLKAADDYERISISAAESAAGIGIGKLLEKYNTAVKGGTAIPPEAEIIGQIKARARQMRQDAYNNYVSAIRRNGGNAEDLVVLPDGSVVPKSVVDETERVAKQAAEEAAKRASTEALQSGAATQGGGTRATGASAPTSPVATGFLANWTQQIQDRRRQVRQQQQERATQASPSWMFGH